VKPAPNGVPVYGVKWLGSYLRDKLQSDPNLRTIAIRGEITNFKISARGHANFSLSEDAAVLQCFAWEDDANGFPAIEAGSKVIATGSISTYEGRSSYQLVVRRLQLDGIGDAQRLFDERKKKLAAEGLFAPERKRPLPAVPFRVALVSSRRADGAIDFVTRLRRLRPHVRVVWCETSVQGPNAAHEIVGALGRASRLDVDLIVVTRGGGSFEDLFAFSDENVVRAIAAAKHPVLCAVGHTVNQQLADFAADAHAETPSAAAERVGPETAQLQEGLNASVRRARVALERKLERLAALLAAATTRSRLADARLVLLPARQRLDLAEEALAGALPRGLTVRRERLSKLAARLQAHAPGVRLERRGARLRELDLALERLSRQRLTDLARRLEERSRALAPAARAVRERAGHRLSLVTVKMAGNDPEAILKKGYAIVTHAGRILLDPRAVEPGAVIEARLARGRLSARVEPEISDGNERIG
jgi:exodeoxyribonuclease VII large subunit